MATEFTEVTIVGPHYWRFHVFNFCGRGESCSDISQAVNDKEARGLCPSLRGCRNDRSVGFVGTPHSQAADTSLPGREGEEVEAGDGSGGGGARPRGGGVEEVSQQVVVSEDRAGSGV